jgi:Na+/H+-dicarboxylate symporter
MMSRHFCVNSKYRAASGLTYGLASINVNPSLITIILGVDRILDMCRTTLNVTGDITAATYVARSEGHKLLTTPKSEWL